MNALTQEVLATMLAEERAAERRRVAFELRCAAAGEKHRGTTIGTGGVQAKRRAKMWRQAAALVESLAPPLLTTDGDPVLNAEHHELLAAAPIFVTGPLRSDPALRSSVGSTTDVRKRIEEAKETAAAFNLHHPIGTPVRAFPGVRNDLGCETTTRSAAWTIGTSAVVAVEGHAGGIALTHVDVLPREG